MNYYKLSAKDASYLLQKRKVSSVELVKSSLNRIDQLEKDLKAFITVTEKEALEVAVVVDKKRKNGWDLPPLAGVPAVLKDNICTSNIRTTCGSKMLADYIPPYDAHVVDLLHKGHVPFLGKTNMDEFAMGSSTETSAFGPTLNPWNFNRVPGGSSGGSAVAVATGEAFWALGSDTGGSIRQPASYCGLIGLKPTYGLVSRYGLVAHASSLDQIGPLTRTVEDCSLVLGELAGYDPRDSTSIKRPRENYRDYLQKPSDSFKVGLPLEYLEMGIQPGVKKVILEAVEKMRNLGVEVEEISLPHASYGLPAYYIVSTAEASSNLSRYDGVQYGYSRPAEDLYELYCATRREGFSSEVKRRIMLGTFALSSGYYDAYYLKALKVRSLVKQDFDRAFQTFDFIITPTTPSVAFPLGDKIDDPLQMYLNDIFTVTVNMIGAPALSLPCGFSEELPVGLQIIGKPFHEGELLQIAFLLEQSRLWETNKLPLKLS